MSTQNLEDTARQIANNENADPSSRLIAADILDLLEGGRIAAARSLVRHLADRTIEFKGA